jgi:hypothetical protein
LVNVTKKPISVVEDVGKIHTMPGSATVLPVDLEDPKGSGPTAGRTRNLTATG